MKVDNNILKDEVFSKDSTIKMKDLKIEKLTNENRTYRRQKIKKSAAVQTVQVRMCMNACQS